MIEPDASRAPNRLTATEAATLISAGRLSSSTLVQSCLDRIAMRERTVHAWANIDPAAAMDQAHARDAEATKGLLHGIPVAVKDVIDVAGVPTGMGSPIYDGYVPFADAACVAALRSAGAVILGKTVTAEFAGVSPGPTTHPAAPDRTPGGSSSGSAAAVADHMVSVALGTQTGGSIIRPAAFCGVVGFKPSFGTINRAGLKFAAESFDTIGMMARDVNDVALVWRALVGAGTAPLGTPETPPRLLVFRGHQWDRAASETVSAIQQTVRRLRDRGAHIEELPVPDGFAELSKARIVINGYERARALAWELQYHARQLSSAMLRVVTDGRTYSYDSYLAAVRLVESWRVRMADIIGAHDAILTAAVNGEAPMGLASTGDASFQEIWSLLHLPAMTLPLATGPSGLPVGVQLVGRRLDDARLLQLAKWVLDICTPPSPFESTDTGSS
jgi:amidase